MLTNAELVADIEATDLSDTPAHELSDLADCLESRTVEAEGERNHLLAAIRESMAELGEMNTAYSGLLSARTKLRDEMDRRSDPTEVATG